MEITATWVTLNIAYVLYVFAAVPKKIIPIRSVLIAASAAFIVYGIVASIWSIVIWNILFGGAQLFQLIRLLMADRNLHFTAEEQAAHQRIFPDLSGRDFLYVWNLGEEQEIPTGTTVMHQGVPNTDLMLLLDGAIVALIDGEEIATREPYTLLGEMSFLTGAPASADVRVLETMRVRCWPQEKLRALHTLKPDVHASLIAGMGRQVTAKLASR